jgi:hypothetical protein
VRHDGPEAYNTGRWSSPRDSHSRAELAICLDGSKARRVLGFKPVHPSIQVDELQRIVKDFQADGIW